MRKIFSFIGRCFLAIVGAPPNMVDDLAEATEPAGDGQQVAKPGEIIFRDATEQDLKVIVALLADDFLGRERETLSDPLDEAYITAFRNIKKQLGNRVIVSIDEFGDVVGCLQLTITPGLARKGASRATIEGVRIRSDKRGSGLGAAMFENAIENARQEGCALVQLTTDKQRSEALNFYERLGFDATHVGMKLLLISSPVE